MSAAAGAPSAREGAGRAEWLRVYDRMVAVLRKNHRHVEALLADRARLAALVKIQNEFWVARDRLLRGRLRETRGVESCVKRCDEAKLELLLGDKEREARRYEIYAKYQDDDLEDFKACAEALAEENTRLKIRLKEVEISAQHSEKTPEHEHSGRKWRAELRELKQAYKNLRSEKDKEISELTAHKDFVWHQFKTMEKGYDTLLEKKKAEAARAAEEAQMLRHKVEELQAAAQKKDDDVARLQADANGAAKLVLALEDKLQKLHSLVGEKDEEIRELKGDRLQASQKRKQDVDVTRRKSRSEGQSQRGKSRNNPRRRLVEDQTETSQKRLCASSLSNGVALRRGSSRMHSSSSPAPQQLLLDAPPASDGLI